MSFLKFLRTQASELPQTITDGFLYFVKSNRAIYMDHGNNRVRYNPPADWNQTTTDDPSYIANKPTTVSGYGITDAISSSEDHFGFEFFKPQTIIDNSSVTVIAKLYDYDGNDITQDYPADWYSYKYYSNGIATKLGTGYSKTVNYSDANMVGEIIAAFGHFEDSLLIMPNNRSINMPNNKLLNMYIA